MFRHVQIYVGALGWEVGHTACCFVGMATNRHVNNLAIQQRKIRWRKEEVVAPDAGTGAKSPSLLIAHMVCQCSSIESLSRTEGRSDQ